MSNHYKFLLGTSKTKQSRQICYRITWHQQPSASELAQLSKLLDASVAEVPAQGYLIAPRPGLLPAWSANAYEIVTACGLTSIKAITRAYYYATTKPTYDNLLETVYADNEIASWVAGKQHQPATAVSQEQITEHMAICLDALEREPTAVELALLRESCSEHCRHLTFNTPWAGVDDATTLLTTIKQTQQANPKGTLVAFTDNAAVIETGTKLSVFKAETHNHPTAISPWQGAATGVGGEIRDEVATGAGAVSCAGAAGYMLANADLDITELANNWPTQFASPAQVLLHAPLGAAYFANEYGRPTLTGFCRFFTEQATNRGFVKPVMFAAGMGEITADHSSKPAPGDLLFLLGGPAMLVGLSGGSSASNSELATSAANSVQRANPEMQRRVQEVINRCIAAPHNPIRKLHDLGAGGLGVAAAELVLPQGGLIDLDQVPTAQTGMDACQILLNEAQERYLAAVKPELASELELFCQQENCPFAKIGEVTPTGLFEVSFAGETCVSLSAAVLFGPEKWPSRSVKLPVTQKLISTNPTGIELGEATKEVLSHPNVADKTFLITINDRGVGGKTYRDQLVGPYQVAVADAAVTLLDFGSKAGRALACGECPAVANIAPATGARLAVAEALTNLASAVAAPLHEIKLALNWLGNTDAASCGELVAAVRGVCEPFLQELGLAVVGGKDSLAMRAHWSDAAGQPQTSTAPTSVIATAIGQVADVAQVRTPQLSGQPDTLLMRLSTATTQQLGGSVFATCYELAGNDCPEITANQLQAWWNTVSQLHAEKLMLAYHDISDGGCLATVAEMGFATNSGVTLVVDSLCQPAMGLDTDGYEQSMDTTAPGGIARIAAELFSEQPGAIIEIRRADAPRVLEIARKHGCADTAITLGWPNQSGKLQVIRNATALVDIPISELRQSWSNFNFEVRRKRDHPDLAKQELAHAGKNKLFATPHIPALATQGRKPLAIILRDQGCNAHAEMAAALTATGFASTTITVTELLAGTAKLDGALLVIPGGFTHGDVFGAGVGTAAKFLHNEKLRAMLQEFFARDTLSLGICNGCQIFSYLGELLEQPCSLPKFTPNLSTRFECRLAQVEILPCNSPFLAPLAGISVPVPVSCQQGNVAAITATTIQPALRFVTQTGVAATHYPANPTGATAGYCGLSTDDGKLTMLMPHPERAIDAKQLSWCPPAWQSQATAWFDSFVYAANSLR